MGNLDFDLGASGTNVPSLDRARTESGSSGTRRRRIAVRRVSPYFRIVHYFVFSLDYRVRREYRSNLITLPPHNPFSTDAYISLNGHRLRNRGAGKHEQG